MDQTNTTIAYVLPISLGGPMAAIYPVWGPCCYPPLVGKRVLELPPNLEDVAGEPLQAGYLHRGFPKTTYKMLEMA